MNMPKATIWFAAALILLGVIGYVATGMVSVTALIPAFFGLVFLILGVLARKESLAKHVMHAASVLALLGVAGSFSGIPSVITMLGGGAVGMPAAAVSRAIMALLSLGYLVLCIKSFIDARRTRLATES